MPRPKKKPGLRYAEIEQLHLRLAQYTKERFQFLIDEYGFTPPTTDGFNAEVRGGATKLAFRKLWQDTRLTLVIQMEYTAVWIELLWKIGDKWRMIGLTEAMNVCCPDRTFSTESLSPMSGESVNDEEECRQYLDFASRVLQEHFKGLFQGDLAMLQNPRRRKRT